MCRRTLLNDFPRKNCKSWKGSDLRSTHYAIRSTRRWLWFHNQTDKTPIATQSDPPLHNCAAQCLSTTCSQSAIRHQWDSGGVDRGAENPISGGAETPVEPGTVATPLGSSPLTTATCHHISVFILMSFDYQGQSNIMPRMPKQTRPTLVWLGIRELGETEMWTPSVAKRSFC